MDNVKGTMKSYDDSKSKDCFDRNGSSTIDHVYPLSEEGSNSEENKQLLTRESNEEKGNETSGEVNGIRFSIEVVGQTDSNKKIGQMYIKKNDGWYKIIKIK